jgi:hypothetical protein
LGSLSFIRSEATLFFIACEASIIYSPALTVKDSSNQNNKPPPYSGGKSDAARRASSGKPGMSSTKIPFLYFLSAAKLHYPLSLATRALSITLGIYQKYILTLRNEEFIVEIR